MTKKSLFNFTGALICSLLLVGLFVTCEDPKEGDKGGGSYGLVREPTVSHASGLYSSAFNLTIESSEGTTIYYSIDGSIPNHSKLVAGRTFKYTGPVNIKNRNTSSEPNFLWTAANIPNFYGAANDSRGHMPQPPNLASNYVVPKVTVIRAVAVDSGGNRSKPVTRTFFIGNNLTPYGTTSIMSIVTDPKNLLDEKTGIYVRGNMGNRWNADGPSGQIYNFQQRGRDRWEREAYLDYFIDGGKQVTQMSTGMGIRIRGGWSRAVGQRSFNIFFRDEYGINNLRNYNLIPGAVQINGSPVERYKSIMIRNGGNDTDYTKFYDVFLQDLVKDRSFTTQAAIPVVLFLNGEYWGFYNLQERYSNQHIEYKYGVNRDNVMVWDNNEQDEGIPSDVPIYWDMINYKDKNLSDNNIYNEFCGLFDIQNFIDYFAAQIYIFNEDWPHNNFRLWRARSREAGNPYGDQKWRWEMFDTEFAMGIYTGGSTTGQDGVDPFTKIKNNGHHNNQLFVRLLTNESFSRQFVNTMMDLYNVNFHPDNYLPKLDKIANTYRPLMMQYYDRWVGWDGGFDGKVNEAKRYLQDIRPVMTQQYLPNHLSSITGISASNLTDVTLNAKYEGIILNNASIKINTITPNLTSGNWTGKYYSNNPITLTANNINGFTFNNWTITSGTIIEGTATSSTIKVNNFFGGATITANYTAGSMTIVDVTGVSLNKNTLNLNEDTAETLIATVQPSNATFKAITWSSNAPGIASVDNHGKVTATGNGTATITATSADGNYNATCTVNVKGRTVLLDFASIIHGLNLGIINSHEEFDAIFDDHFIKAGAGIHPTEGAVAYEVINEGGINKLQVHGYDLWGPGINILNAGIGFQAGDTIEIKGRFVFGPGVIIDISSGTEQDGWDPLQNWGVYNSPTDFHHTFTLTSFNVSRIHSNGLHVDGAIRFRTGGIHPYYGRDPAGIASFIIEQIKIRGIRE
jgi:hypothetical protein